MRKKISEKAPYWVIMNKRLRNTALDCEDFEGRWGNRENVLVRGYFLLLLKLFLFLAFKRNSPNCFFFHSSPDAIITISRKFVLLAICNRICPQMRQNNHL